jgi:hypothetical protein
MIKSIFSSKTFWKATLIAVAGVLSVYENYYPALGALAIVNSMIDIYIRSITTQPVAIV